MLNVIIKHDQLLYLKKLFALASADKSEVMTYPIYSIKKEDDVVTLTIEDLITPTQVVTGVTCEALSKDEAVKAEIPLDKIVTLHHAIAKCRSLSLDQDSSWGWIHLHPNGITPSPSSTDTNQQKIYLGINGEDFQRDMTLMLIFNEGVDTQSHTCEVWFKSSHRIFDDNILKIQGNIIYDYFTSEKTVEEIITKAESDYKERVRTSTALTTPSYNRYTPIYGYNHNHDYHFGDSWFNKYDHTATDDTVKEISDNKVDDKFFTSLNSYSEYDKNSKKHKTNEDTIAKESKNEPVQKSTNKGSWFNKIK